MANHIYCVWFVKVTLAPRKLLSSLKVEHFLLNNSSLQHRIYILLLTLQVLYLLELSFSLDMIVIPRRQFHYRYHVVVDIASGSFVHRDRVVVAAAYH
jgi:hypothetical protein